MDYIEINHMNDISYNIDQDYNNKIALSLSDNEETSLSTSSESFSCSSFNDDHYSDNDIKDFNENNIFYQIYKNIDKYPYTSLKFIENNYSCEFLNEYYTKMVYFYPYNDWDINNDDYDYDENELQNINVELENINIELGLDCPTDTSTTTSKKIKHFSIFSPEAVMTFETFSDHITNKIKKLFDPVITSSSYYNLITSSPLPNNENIKYKLDIKKYKNLSCFNINMMIGKEKIKLLAINIDKIGDNIAVIGIKCYIPHQKLGYINVICDSNIKINNSPMDNILILLFHLSCLIYNSRDELENIFIDHGENKKSRSHLRWSCKLFAIELNNLNNLKWSLFTNKIIRRSPKQMKFKGKAFSDLKLISKKFWTSLKMNFMYEWIIYVDKNIADVFYKNNNIKNLHHINLFKTWYENNYATIIFQTKSRRKMDHHRINIYFDEGIYCLFIQPHDIHIQLPYNNTYINNALRYPRNIYGRYHLYSRLNTIMKTYDRYSGSLNKIIHYNCAGEYKIVKDSQNIENEHYIINRKRKYFYNIKDNEFLKISRNQIPPSIKSTKFKPLETLEFTHYLMSIYDYNSYYIAYIDQISDNKPCNLSSSSVILRINPKKTFNSLGIYKSYNILTLVYDTNKDNFNISDCKNFGVCHSRTNVFSSFITNDIKDFYIKSKSRFYYIWWKNNYFEYYMIHSKSSTLGKGLMLFVIIEKYFNSSYVKTLSWMRLVLDEKNYTSSYVMQNNKYECTRIDFDEKDRTKLHFNNKCNYKYMDQDVTDNDEICLIKLTRPLKVNNNIVIEQYLYFSIISVSSPCDNNVEENYITRLNVHTSLTTQYIRAFIRNNYVSNNKSTKDENISELIESDINSSNLTKISKDKNNNVVLPMNGILAYKVCISKKRHALLVTFYIPPTSMVATETYEKYRMSHVMVVDIQPIPELDNGKGLNERWTPKLPKLIKELYKHEKKGKSKYVSFKSTCPMCMKPFASPELDIKEAKLNSTRSDINHIIMKYSPCNHLICFDCHIINISKSAMVKKGSSLPICCVCNAQFNSAQECDKNDPLLENYSILSYHYEKDKKIKFTKAYSFIKEGYEYQLGGIYHCSNYNLNLQLACATGFHCFLEFSNIIFQYANTINDRKPYYDDTIFIKKNKHQHVLSSMPLGISIDTASPSSSQMSHSSDKKILDDAEKSETFSINAVTPIILNTTLLHENTINPQLLSTSEVNVDAKLILRQYTQKTHLIQWKDTSRFYDEDDESRFHIEPTTMYTLSQDIIETIDISELTSSISPLDDELISSIHDNINLLTDYKSIETPIHKLKSITKNIQLEPLSYETPRHDCVMNQILEDDVAFWTPEVENDEN